MSTYIHHLPAVSGQLLLKVGVQLSDLQSAKPLTGGVASDVWLLETSDSQFCLKQALGTLRVTQDWQVDLSRNAFEVQWLKVAEGILHSMPSCHVPKVLAQSDTENAFLMEYFDSKQYPVWKKSLASGDVNSEVAAKLGSALGLIHQTTAADKSLKAKFENDSVFHQIRIEPYFLATAKANPDVAQEIKRLSKLLSETELALVHGDISPKNILAHVEGETVDIVILDAECAVYSDPAFDLAFLLNHLLLKSFLVPKKLNELHRCATRALESYLVHVNWEAQSDFKTRVRAYLAVFLLARVDGKSPLEYINIESDKNIVRAFAKRLLVQAPMGRSDDVEGMLALGFKAFNRMENRSKHSNV